MRYRTLGRTGVRVSELCLGAMMFGRWGNPDHDDSIAIIHRALDAGVNFVDTADVYSRGESEEIVGRALRGRRADVVLATKAHGAMDAEPNHRGSSRRWLVREVEASLSRLDTDHIDLYQMHRWDDEADIEETLSALTDLQRAGKIRYFGSSSFPAHRLVEAQWAAARCGLGRMVTEQPQYSMLVRGIEADVLAVVQQYGLGVLVWSPLAAGWLSGRHRSEGAAPGQSRTRWSPGRYDMSLPENQRKLQLVERLAAVADDHDLSLIQLALAFTTSHPAVTSAIIGPRTHEHLDSQLAAADLSLSDELLDAIDAIVPPGTTAPGEETGQPPAVTERRLRRRG